MSKFLLDPTDAELFDDCPAYGVTLEALFSMRLIEEKDLRIGEN